ncbi:MAG: hypothetical protein WCT18_04085 [Patescibacteria group bacterium]
MPNDNTNLEKPMEIAPNLEVPKNLPTAEESVVRASQIQKELAGDLGQEEIKTGEAKPNEGVATSITAPSVQGTAPQKPPKSENLQQIEKILSEGLDDLYKTLPDNRKAEFRQEGEVVARKIEVLLTATKIKVSQIIKVIVGWLRMIPGVNKFFLEQSTKIKVDELLELKEKK